MFLRVLDMFLLAPVVLGDFPFASYYGLGSRYTVLHEPTTEAEIIEAVLSAYERGTTTLRVAGTSHSETGHMLPDGGELMDLHLYRNTIEITETTATFEAGITLLDATNQLEARGLTFENAPKLLDFSLGGVVSTGASGSGGTELPTISGQVVALRLVVGNGTAISVSESLYPDIFAAARLAMGYMGVISTVTLKVVPLYSLKRATSYFSFEDFPSKMSELISGRVFAFWMSPGDLEIAAQIYTKTDEPIDESGCYLPGNGDCIGYPNKAYPDYTGTYDELFMYQSAHLDIELHMRFEDAEDFIAEWIQRSKQILKQFPNTKVLHYSRSHAADSIWLSPAYELDAYKIAIQVMTDVTLARSVLIIAWRRLAKKYNARPHWGKINPLTVEETQAMYPRFDDFAAQRNIVDPTGVFMNDYGKLFFGERHEVFVYDDEGVEADEPLCNQLCSRGG